MRQSREGHSTMDTMVESKKKKKEEKNTKTGQPCSEPRRSRGCPGRFSPTPSLLLARLGVQFGHACQRVPSEKEQKQPS